MTVRDSTPPAADSLAARAADARYFMSAARVLMIKHGWTPVRVDRFERGRDSVELGYVYGEVRLTVRTLRVPTGKLDLRLFGPTEQQNQAKFDRFAELVSV